MPALVKDLFCWRDKELEQGLKVLDGNLDVGGMRAATRDKRPWVIHGDTRSGKSHLARRLMLEKMYAFLPVAGRDKLKAAA